MGAFFFAMRSCEYCKAGKEDSKRTRILWLRNIRFFKNKKLIPHDSPHISNADYVVITFECQKKDQRNDSGSMYRSTKGAQFDAVSIWEWERVVPGEYQHEEYYLRCEQDIVHHVSVGDLE